MSHDKMCLKIKSVPRSKVYQNKCVLKSKVSHNQKYPKIKRLAKNQISPKIKSVPK